MMMTTVLTAAATELMMKVKWKYIYIRKNTYNDDEQKNEQKYSCNKFISEDGFSYILQPSFGIYLHILILVCWQVLSRLYFILSLLNFEQSTE